MPIVLTFDLYNGTVDNWNNRLRSAMERFGWERVGGSAWRYPRSDEQGKTEDWFNEVLPALLYVRQAANAMPASVDLERFSIDVHGSFSQFMPGLNPGLHPKQLDAGDLHTTDPLGNPVNQQQGAAPLLAWMNGLGFTFPAPP